MRFFLEGKGKRGLYGWHICDACQSLWLVHSLNKPRQHSLYFPHATYTNKCIKFCHANFAYFVRVIAIS